MPERDKPIRYTLPMQPGFAEQYRREQVIGSPIRESLGPDVIIQGIVVDWIERDDRIDLLIEVQP